MNALGARPVLLVAVALLVLSGCGLFSEGTVISPAPITEEEHQADVQSTPFPTATPAGAPLPADAIVIGALWPPPDSWPTTTSPPW